MNLAANDILNVDHVRALGFDAEKDFAVTGVSTDSRTVKRGDLFVAIRGGQFDGHDFVTKAYESGAAAAVVDVRWADTNPAMMISVRQPRLVVEDTVAALGQLARLYRRRFRIPVVAIGGSNGKTTTKDMVALVLSAKYSVLSTEGNLNNHIGVPLTLFRLEQEHKVAVVEMGTNHPGEVRNLCSIAEPTHGLITNVGREHLEFFKSIDGVARAEAELFDWIRESKGTAFVNASDRRLARHARKIAKTVVYGRLSNSADVRGSVLRMSEYGTATVRIKPKRRKAFELALSVAGSHNAWNALAAATVGMAFRVPAADIGRALSQFVGSSKRMQSVRLNGTTILNDTYNANPESMLAALETLAEVETRGKRIAVLADMLELGAVAPKQHRLIGNAVARLRIDVLLTFGPLSQQIFEGARMVTKRHFEQKHLLAEHLAGLVAPGDVVLVKGSRGMRMEEVVAYLSERFHQAA